MPDTNTEIQLIPKEEVVPVIPQKDVVVSKVISTSDQEYQEYPDWQKQKIEQSGGYPIVRRIVTGNNSEVVYLGVEHSSDPDNPQNVRISAELDRLSIARDPKNCVVFYEGGVGVLPSNAFEGLSRQQVIRNYSEAGLLGYEALKRGIKVEGMEPSRRMMIEEIKSKYPDLATDDDFALLQTFMYLNSQIRIHQMENVMDSQNLSQRELFGIFNDVSSSIGWREKETGIFLKRLNNSGFTEEQKDEAIKHFVTENAGILNQALQKRIGRNLFDDGKVLFSEDELLGFYNPGNNETIFNKIAKLQTDMRDRYAVGKIHDAVSSGKNVLIAAGDSHLFRSQPALEVMSAKKLV